MNPEHGGAGEGEVAEDEFADGEDCGDECKIGRWWLVITSRRV